MGLLEGIGGALSGAWNATVGQAVKAVTQIFGPPPPPPAPTLTKDAVSLSAGATNWEASAQIIAGNTGSLIGNNGANVVSNHGGGLIGNNGANLIGNNGATILSDQGGR